MSFDDPFEFDPAEASSPEAEAAPVVVKSAAVGSGDGKIVSTYKTGAGYDASWTVVHAESVDDWFAIHEDPRFPELLAKQKKVAAFFLDKPASQQANQTNPSRAPQQASEPPSWAPEKPHDDFVYRSGVSAKTGKPWHAWMAPNKGDTRPAVWFYPPK